MSRENKLNEFPRDQKRGLIEALHVERVNSLETKFPRDQKRGLIEAGLDFFECRKRLPISARSKARSHGSIRADKHASSEVTDFRAIKSAVSLKRGAHRLAFYSQGDFRAIKSAVSLKLLLLVLMLVFPRDQKRGLIEAMSSTLRISRFSQIFPRDQKRGLIEAKRFTLGP